MKGYSIANNIYKYDCEITYVKAFKNSHGLDHVMESNCIFERSLILNNSSFCWNTHINGKFDLIKKSWELNVCGKL